MLDPDTRSEQEIQLKAHRQTLAFLLEQAAAYGGEVFAPPVTRHGIADARAGIKRIKTTLRSVGVAVEDAPNDEPAPANNSAARQMPGAGVSGQHNDQRRGVFVEGGSVYGPIIGEQHNYYPPGPNAELPPLALPWNVPGQRTDLRAWWRWLLRSRHLILRRVAGLVALYLVAAMLLQWRPFQPRLGWRALGPQPPVKALALRQVGSVLLLGSATDFPGCSPDTGIWRSADGGQTWAPVPAPLALSTETCPHLAAIKAFAQSPALPQRVFAATSDAGLLRSDGEGGIGLSWVRVESADLPAQLRTVAVMPTDANRLFVAAEPGNLFRSINGGVSWTQLDGHPTCLDSAHGDSLPAPIDPESLLTTPGAVYVGTRGTISAASPHAGLYASVDGGSCWQRLHDGNRRYRYLSLAAHGSNTILALTYDFHGLEGAVYQLWEMDLATREARLVWQTGTRLRLVYTDARAPQAWYVMDGFGALRQGSLGATSRQDPVLLGRVTRCILDCNLALTADLDTRNTTTPLLLAEDRVYRLEQVPWYRAIWP